jgi:hypothetical protein
LCLGDVLVDPPHPIEQRVLGVQMQMREFGHVWMCFPAALSTIVCAE